MHHEATGSSLIGCLIPDPTWYARAMMSPKALAPTSTRAVRRRRPYRLAALLAVTAIAIAACGDDDDTEPSESAPRESLSSEPYPSAELTVRHRAPQADVDVTYTLTCAPADATLDGDDVEVDPAAACEALDDPAVVDWLVDGPPEDQICTEQYGGEDTAAIEGTIERAPIDITVDRVDGCGISTWDELLDPLLPPAVGVTDGGN